MPRNAEDADWMLERQKELVEKQRRGEPLSHEERLSLAMDEVSS